MAKTKKKTAIERPSQMLDSEALTWMYIAMALIENEIDSDLGITILCRIAEAENGKEIPGKLGFELKYDGQRLARAARGGLVRAWRSGFDDSDAHLLYETAVAWQTRAPRAEVA